MRANVQKSQSFLSFTIVPRLQINVFVINVNRAERQPCGTSTVRNVNRAERQPCGTSTTFRTEAKDKLRHNESFLLKRWEKFFFNEKLEINHLQQLLGSYSRNIFYLFVNIFENDIKQGNSFLLCL